MNFKVNDRVRILENGVYYYGQITIVSESMGCKVLFDSGDGPDYWYYKESELELVTEEDVKEL